MKLLIQFVQSLEWISNFIWHCVMDVLVYFCLDLSQSNFEPSRWKSSADWVPQIYVNYCFLQISSSDLTKMRAYTWWRHQMEAFSALMAVCAGNSPVTGEFPAQRPVTRALMFSLICAWTNGRVNNRKGGDLRRHGTDYDVIAMLSQVMSVLWWLFAMDVKKYKK